MGLPAASPGLQLAFFFPGPPEGGGGGGGGGPGGRRRCRAGAGEREDGGPFSPRLRPAGRSPGERGVWGGRGGSASQVEPTSPRRCSSPSSAAAGRDGGGREPLNPAPGWAGGSPAGLSGPVVGGQARRRGLRGGTARSAAGSIPRRPPSAFLPRVCPAEGRVRSSPPSPPFLPCYVAFPSLPTSPVPGP